MIEKIQIRGFRVHEKLDIEFDPLVTTIIGSNFVGKSTIIRAIRWVVRNQPAGEQVINWDSELAAVRLFFDGKNATRKRGAGVNQYKYSKVKEPYAAFRGEVPAAIRDALNISDVNFQGQQKAPFWFCETAGEVSRQLNAIVDLKVIDDTLANVADKLHKSKVAVEVVGERLSKIVEGKKNLAYIEELNEDFVALETLHSQFEEFTEEGTRLAERLSVRTNLRLRRKTLLELATDGSFALSAGRLYRKVTTQVEGLQNLLETGQALQEAVSRKPPSLKPLEKLRAELDDAVNEYDGLFSLVEAIESSRSQKCQAEKDLRISKVEFETAAGKICPLCGQKMPK